MKPVTDPAILAELEAPQGTLVTDPVTLSLLGEPVPKWKPSSGIYDKIQQGVLDGESQIEKAVDRSSRFGRGMMDPITGLAQTVWNAMPEWYKNLSPDFNEHITRDEQFYQAQRKEAGQEGLDAYRLGGNLATAVPAALAAPAAATSLPGMAATSAGYGAVFGASEPVYGAGDFWHEKAKQTGIGAASGLVAAPVAAGVARAVKPVTNKAAQLLMKEGVTPTPGSMVGGAVKATEDKLTSVPLMGDLIRWGQKRSLNEFNRAVYNRALKPIGQSGDKLPIGRDGVQAVKAKLGKAYEELLPKVTFTADREFVNDLTTVRGMVTTLPDDIAKQFDKILKTKLIEKMTPAGTMSGETLKVVESELGRMGSGYRATADFDKRQLGDAIHELQSAIRRTLERSNPNYAEQLSKINSGYANYAILRRAASMANTADGITPSQLASAVKAMDKSVGKGATASGTARMQDLSDAGVEVLASKYPDSGTAGRLLDIGAVAAGVHNPAIPLGLAAAGLPYTPTLQRAIAKLLEQRGAWAGPASQAIRQSGPVVGAVAAPSLLDALVE